MTEVTPRFKQPREARRRRAWNSTLPARSGRRGREPKAPGQTGVTASMRSDAYRRANGVCQADGAHHPDCPGQLPHGDWVPHHVWPRSKGGPDSLDNLVAVWCPMGLGQNGCHGRVHQLSAAEGERLGLLLRKARRD